MKNLQNWLWNGESGFLIMVRLENTAELSYDGRTFTMNKKYYPYPLPQLDKSPILKEYADTHPDH
jgi:hypothetical protein